MKRRSGTETLSGGHWRVLPSGRASMTEAGRRLAFTTSASHLIIDLRLDVAQVSRILGHARVTTTLDVYTHMFDEARHTLDVRAQTAGSAFADLLDRSGEERGSVITLPQADETPKGSLSAKERAALRWAT